MQQQPHIGGRPANGDLTLCLSHVAVCPEEEMGVIGGAEKRACAAMGWGKNSGSGTQHWSLNLVMERVGCGEAPHKHQMG